jgi:N12 class adenine-specific DNA methylase
MLFFEAAGLHTLCRGHISNPNSVVQKNVTITNTYEIIIMFRTNAYVVCPKSIQLYFFPHKVIAKGWGNSVVVEATFMHMHDFLLPHNTAGCVYHCQIVK